MQVNLHELLCKFRFTQIPMHSQMIFIKNTGSIHGLRKEHKGKSLSFCFHWQASYGEGKTFNSHSAITRACTKVQVGQRKAAKDMKRGLKNQLVLHVYWFMQKM